MQKYCLIQMKIENGKMVTFPVPYHWAISLKSMNDFRERFYREVILGNDDCSVSTIQQKNP